jgi:hypothetical protein
MAMQQPTQGHKSASKKTVLFNRLPGILGTGGSESAGRGQNLPQRTLIDLNQRYRYVLYHHREILALPFWRRRFRVALPPFDFIRHLKPCFRLPTIFVGVFKFFFIFFAPCLPEAGFMV